MNKNQVMKVLGFCLAFICLGVGSGDVWATQVQVLNTDTVDLAIEYHSAYPGKFVEIEVLMRNPEKISSFAIHITLGGWDLINFTTDRIDIDSVWAPIDTCPDPDTVCTVDTCSCGEGEPDTCACFEYHKFPVRECYLDTVGSLISDFKDITCHGDTGDTSLPDCKWVTVYGFAGYDSIGDLKYIEESGNYRLLFKFGVDLSCLCDSDTGRTVYFLISQGFSNFSDNLGYSVPFRYYPPGEIFAWWSVPGDASNDSAVNAGDVIFLVNYLFLGASPPCIIEAADADSSCEVDVGDIIYLGNYLFMGAAPPKRGCAPCPEPQKGRRIEEDFELFEDLNRKPLLERR